MNDQRLVLTPPGPVPAVSTDQAAASAHIDPAAAEKITATVGAFVEGLAALDPHSPDFQKKVDSISQLGNQEIRQSAEVSNRFLERPAAAMERGPLGAGSQLSRSLVQLRRQLEDLDPSRQKLLEPSRLLGKLPGLRQFNFRSRSGLFMCRSSVHGRNRNLCDLLVLSAVIEP